MSQLTHDTRTPEGNTLSTLAASWQSDRRSFLKAGLVAGVASAAAGLTAGVAAAAGPYADPEKPALPPSDMRLDLPRTAVVVTDPQIDFLSPKGVAWGGGEQCDGT